MKLLNKNTGLEHTSPAQLAAAQTRSVLLGLLQKRLIPQLAARHGTAPWSLPVADPRVAELAHLLLASNSRAACGLLEERHGRAESDAALCASLFEPAARCLGDLWGADDCSEVEVTLGLHRLQVAMHKLGSGLSRRALRQPRAVLVVPQPGEVHMLGSVLDAELLWQAGWDTQACFPATDEALQAMLAGTWFDALDLSLSAAFRREHCLARMTQTIARARRASLNPALGVVVGGRVFCEEADAAARVGADVGSKSAAQVSMLLLEAVSSARRPTLSVS